MRASFPDHPFRPWDQDYGIGAVELAAHYSTIHLNDNFQPGVVPKPGTNPVGGGRRNVYQVGPNWYPNANIRFMLDYLPGMIHKAFSIAAGGGIVDTPLGTPLGGQFRCAGAALAICVLGAGSSLSPRRGEGAVCAEAA